MGKETQLLEIRLAKLGAWLYRKSLDAALVIANRRDKQAYVDYEAQMQRAVYSRESAVRLVQRAEEIETEANKSIDEHNRALTAAVNQLQNARDDLKLV